MTLDICPKHECVSSKTITFVYYHEKIRFSFVEFDT